MKNIIIKQLCFFVALACISCKEEATVVPEQINIVDAVFASGHIVLENEYQIAAGAEGYLVAAHVAEGDKVQQGIPLFQLSNEVEHEQLGNAQDNYRDAQLKMQADAPQQAQLKLQIEQAQVQLSLDQSNFDRHKRLVKSGAVSQMDFDRAKAQYENAQRQVNILEKSLSDLVSQLELNLKNSKTQLNIKRENLNDFQLSSAISGVVLKRHKEQGELVRRGEVIASIGGGAPIAKLFIAEEDINRIKVGQKVAIALNTDKEGVQDAIITKIYPSFDEKEQSFICEARFSNAPKLYAYTRLQANIVVNQKENALAIPSEYLLEGDSVRTKEGELLALNIGLRNKEWAEVLSGLTGSETLIK